MKVTAIHSIVVGKGAKARTVEPGTEFDPKAAGLDVDEVQDLAARGFIALPETAKPAAEVTPPAGEAGDGATGD